MSPVALLTFCNLLSGGLLAGAELAVHHAVVAPMETLDASAQLQLRQALILKLRVLIPALFIPAALSGAALLIRQASGPGLALRCLGMAAILTWIALRVVGTVPINSATLTWSRSAPPPDWQRRIAHAERFHIVGVYAAILSFACSLFPTLT